MGLLSCFTPLLPSRSSASSSADSLLQEKSYLIQSDEERHAVDDSAPKLAKLRALMVAQNLDVYVVPTADAHGSEYVGERDKRRAWLSGFTGSAGVAVVTKDRALLFTDSRYYVQAAKQLGSRWELQKVGLSKFKKWDEWLLDLDKGMNIGIDSTLVDYATTKPLKAKLLAKELALVFPATNLVDCIWTDRPTRSASTIVLHPLKFTGLDAKCKISSLRKYLNDKHSSSSAFLLSSLPNIAWLLNLRGLDIASTPLFYAYALVPASADAKWTLWVQKDAMTKELEVEMMRLDGVIREYEKALEGVKGWKGKMVCDGKISWALVEAAGEDNVTVVASPVTAAEGIKNETEIAGFRAAYRRDGAAWVRWVAWLEEQLKKGKKISEWEAGEKLTEYRKEGENYAGPAYGNISATGENAALPHYAPTATSSRIIDITTPYLNDSGPQYLDGTIDTTRTYHFGKPSAEHKRAFTRVLQGHIAIDSLIFPEGTTGNLIDIMARAPLYREGMTYLHGTGHGVGEYLSVHEGPHGIAASPSFGAYPFVPGHIMSNEPAYYEQGSYGIRLESVLCVKEVQTRRGFGDKKWLGFERFTKVPIQTRMVEWSLLSPDEQKWLRKHNDECRDSLLELIKHDKRAVKHLTKQ